MDTRRVESFSDGVFAVAITVLVFNLLPIADKTAGSSKANWLTVTHLGHYWPAYLAYVVSFLTIGIMWLNHHTLLAQVTKVDRPLLALNLFLLMGVVAIPFPTALVADHLNNSSQGKVAAVTYGLIMIAISVGFGSMWLYLTSHGESLGGPSTVQTPRASTVRFVSGNAGYLAGALIALASPLAALIIFGLLAVYYMFEHLPDPTAEGNESDGPTAGSGGQGPAAGR